ncbi:MAG: ribokinase [SAR116 cluster bacterium]|nr:MAG: ribokinase [SAR116 cluster bacterium]|tara:strand:+ start:452 stop:1330 length:879 start_codon:yes stop_codon:yes gene_type:complete
MTIFNLGSINLDYFYRLPHLVSAGETLAANDFNIALGGKGANQSVALAKAGAEVFHIGAFGQKDALYLQEMQNAGVNLDFVALLDMPSGHAIIMVDDKTGENQIILSPSANYKIEQEQIKKALQKANSSDWALAQNETCLVEPFLSLAKQQGLKICYSAAPFVAEQTAGLLPLTDLLIVNEGEAAALSDYIEKDITTLGLPHLIITLGSKGARYRGEQGCFSVAPFKVTAIDTTGAGDTFLGFVLASLSDGQTMQQAMRYASAAAALQITRQGALPAIPSGAEVTSFLQDNS